MRVLTANNRLVTVLAIFLTACLAIPYALANTYSARNPTMPSQCTTTLTTGWSSTPIVNVGMTVRNYEDSGVVGYWALDNFVESSVIWQNNSTAPFTFCALDQYSGTWKTFNGALSPQNGVLETHNGYGRMMGVIVKIFTGTFLGPYCKVTTTHTCSGTYSTKRLTGSIGVFNLGGNKSQIVLGNYTNQAPFNPTNFLTYYFTTISITSEPAWSWTYSRGNGVGYGNMWVNYLTGSVGDIVT